MSQFKFRPVGTAGTPPVVLNIIILNVIFFIAKFFAGGKGIDLDDILGLYHPMSPYFHWWQPLTCMFSHSGVMHILFNMIGLFFFGRMLENVWGSKRFLIFYLVCGLGASAVFLGWETFAAYKSLNYDGNGWARLSEYMENWTMVGQEFPAVNSMIYSPMVGASGAVYGLIMGAAMLFPNTTIYLYGAIPVKLKWLALIVGVVALYFGYSPSGDHIAHFAHLGGMIFGFILVQIYKRDRGNFY
jgi:membrane associated rhomboid family serine protease